MSKQNNSTQPLLDFYERILNLGAFVVNDDGIVSTMLSGEATPANIKVDGQSRRLCLPTDYILKANQWDNLIAFHPLNENLFLTRGEPRVIEYLRKAYNYRMNTVLHVIFRDALTLAATPKLHNKMTSAGQMALLTELKDADEKSVHNWERIAETLSITNTRDNLTSLYLKKQGLIGENKFARVGVWTFPLYQELLRTNDFTVHGVKVRKKDIEIYKALYRYLIPNIDDPLFYQLGSNSPSAPYTDALLKAMWRLAEPVNAYVDMMYGKGKSHVTGQEKKDLFDYCHFSEDWREEGANLGGFEKYVRMIPIQDGVEEESKVAAPVTQAAPAPVTPTVPTVSPLAAVQQQAAVAPVPVMNSHIPPSLQLAQQHAQSAPVAPQPVASQPVQHAAPIKQPNHQVTPPATAQAGTKKGTVTMEEIAQYQREQMANQTAMATMGNPFVNPAALQNQQVMQNPLVNPMAAAANLGMLPQVYPAMMPAQPVRQGRLLNQMAQAAYQQPVYPGQMPMMGQPMGAPMGYPMQPGYPVAPVAQPMPYGVAPQPYPNVLGVGQPIYQQAPAGI